MSVLRLSPLLVLGLLLGLGGCGGEPTGTVSGQVTSGGQPVGFGSIGFLTSDGWAGSAPIRDGKYSLAEVPLGTAKVTVQSVAPPPAMSAPGASAGGAAKLPPFVPLPQVYADAAKTPLTYEVKAGEQTHDIDVPTK